MNSEIKTEIINPLTDKETQGLLRGDAMHQKAWASIQKLNKEKDALLQLIMDGIKDNIIPPTSGSPESTLQHPSEGNTSAKSQSVPSSGAR